MMQFKPPYRMILVIFAFLCSGAFAQDEAFWTNGGGDQVWSNPANWDPQGVPLGVHAIINNDRVPAPIITGEVTANRISVARDWDPDREVLGDLLIEDATLTMMAKNDILNGQLVVSGSDWAIGTLTIRNSTVTVPRDMDVSWRGSAQLNMHSGVLDVKGVFGLSSRSTSWTSVQLYGGVIRARDLDWRDSSQSFQTMNITGGKLILTGDKSQTIRDGQNAEYLYAYSGFKGGEIVIDYNEVDDLTLVSATHALNPRPADGSVLPSTKEVELGWTLAEHTVPGQPAKVDVYFTDDYQQLYDFTDPASMQVVHQKSVSSVTVETEFGKSYYWAVDTYIGSQNDPVIGPIFSFTLDHTALDVEAGADVLAVLQDGRVTGPLSGTITSTSNVQSTSVQWSVISEPDPEHAPAVIAESMSLHTTITLTTIGDYEIRLEASDGRQTKADTLVITVYDDPWITLD